MIIEYLKKICLWLTKIWDCIKLRNKEYYEDFSSALFNGLVILIFGLFFLAIVSYQLNPLISWLPALEGNVFNEKALFMILLSLYLAGVTRFFEDEFKETIKYYLLFLSIFSLSIVSFLQIFQISVHLIIEPITYFSFITLISIFCLILLTIKNSEFLAFITTFLLSFISLFYLFLVGSFLCIGDGNDTSGRYCASVQMVIEKGKAESLQKEIHAPEGIE